MRFSFSKKGVAAKLALAVIAGSFGYLMRDLYQFGNMFGDSRPKSHVTAEENAFRNAMKTMDEVIFPNDLIVKINKNMEAIRSEVISCESWNATIETLIQNKNYAEAVENLKGLVGKLKSIKSVSIAKLEKMLTLLTKLAPKKGGYELYNTLVDSLEESLDNLLQDTTKQLAKVQHLAMQAEMIEELDEDTTKKPEREERKRR